MERWFAAKWEALDAALYVTDTHSAGRVIIIIIIIVIIITVTIIIITIITKILEIMIVLPGKERVPVVHGRCQLLDT